ncbi:MAG: acyltransferase family protein [Butyrivibrio sp.]|nr:acyltransferase family protein [Butyrivibrio sp.]
MKRDYAFDNMKVLLIIFVVFGHALEEFGIKGNLGLIRAAIYLFHMPLFIFISGYFSKSDAKPEKLFKTTLIPFIIFNTAWLLIHGSKINEINFFKPIYVFWYLISLFFWRVTVKYFDRIKGIVILAFIIGIYCGCVNEAERFFSISRTVSFFPYFILGYKFKKETIEKIRNIPKVFAVASLMASFAITVYLNVSNIMPVKMYELIQSYKATDLTNMQGMILRGTIYITAIVLVFAIINLMPDKEYRWTKYGQRTLCIYVLSSFVIVQIYRLIENSNLNKESFAIQIVGALFITAVTMVVTGNKYVNKGYSVIMDTLSSKLVNKI